MNGRKEKEMDKKQENENGKRNIKKRIRLVEDDERSKGKN
jgi:hypothetical protein